MKKIIFLILILSQFSLFAKGQVENLSNEYFEIANAYAELKNYEKAIYFYEKASIDEKYKNSCDYNLARMYALQNNWKSATTILQKLHKNDPNNKMILSAYAYSLVGLGKLEEAKKLYKDIAESSPESPQNTLDYIQLLFFAKDYELAKAQVEKAILDYPSAKERPEFDKLQKQIETELNKVNTPEE